MAARGWGLFSLYIEKENFKNLLLDNHWTDFIMLSYCGQSMSVVRRPSCGVNDCFKSLLLLSRAGSGLRIGQTYPLRDVRAVLKRLSVTTRALEIGGCLPLLWQLGKTPNILNRATVCSTGIIPDYKIKVTEMHLKLEKTNFARSILLNLSYLMLLTCFICLCIILCPWVAHETKIITSSVFNICVCLVFVSFFRTLAFSTLKSKMGWSGGAKVLCILHHRGVQLILAYSWARPAILVVGKGRGGMFLFLLFLHFHSCSSFFPVPLFHLLYSLFYLFSPFLWEMTQNDPQGLTCR